MGSSISGYDFRTSEYVVSLLLLISMPKETDHEHSHNPHPIQAEIEYIVRNPASRMMFENSAQDVWFAVLSQLT